MATVEKILAEPISAEGRTVLRGVPWGTYAHLRKLPENYHLHFPSPSSSESSAESARCARRN